MWGVPVDTNRLKIFKQWFAKYPEMAGEYNAKILQYTMGMDYRLICKKPVRTAADFKGLKLKAMGAYANWVQALGGEGVPAPMSECYLSMQKGILDGVLAPYETLKSMKFAEITKYVIELPITSTPNPNRIMNINTWNKLPADIQKVFENNIDFYSEEEERQIVKAGQDGIEFAKTQNVEFITMSQEEMNKIFDPMKTVCLQQAADLDAKKIKGTEYYNALRSLIDQNNK
jgi:TRAP-type transport system periplasmic protein